MNVRRKAAEDRRRVEQLGDRPFESPADLEAFFRACDELEGPAREPEWREHLAVIEESRRKVSSGT